MNHRISHFAAIALMVLLSFSCSRGDGGTAIIQQALAVYESHPDSAMAILHTMDKAKLDRKNLATYALVYSMAQDKSGVDVTNDSLLRIAFDHFSHLPSDTLYARCMYYMGKYFEMADSSEKSTECLEKAIDVSRREADYAVTCLALERLSNILYFTNTSQAVSKAREALELYLQQPKATVTNKMLYRLNLAMCLLRNNQLATARKECCMVLAEARSSDDSLLVSASCQDLSCIYKQLGEPDSTLYYAKQAWDYRPVGDGSLMLALSSAYIDSDSLEQAEDLVRQYLSESFYPLGKYTSYSKLHLIAIKQLDCERAVQMSDSAFYYIEKMYTDALSDKDNYYKEKIRSERDRILTENSLSNQRRLSVMISFFAIVIVLLMLYLIRIQHRVAEQKKQAIYEKALHEQQMMQLELETKEKLHQKQVEHREQQIAMMRKYLLEKVDVAHKFSTIGSGGRKTARLTENDWHELTCFLENVEDRFPSRLRKSYPKLNEEEIRLLLLVRLKLPAKSMAAIYGIEEKSIKQRLFVYKEKVSISQSGLSLRQFIESF